MKLSTAFLSAKIGKKNYLRSHMNFQWNSNHNHIERKVQLESLTFLAFQYVTKCLHVVDLEYKSHMYKPMKLLCSYFLQIKIFFSGGSRETHRTLEAKKLHMARESHRANQGFAA